MEGGGGGGEYKNTEIQKYKVCHEQYKLHHVHVNNAT